MPSRQNGRKNLGLTSQWQTEKRAWSISTHAPLIPDIVSYNSRYYTDYTIPKLNCIS
jgi:hypothetical protein